MTFFFGAALLLVLLIALVVVCLFVWFSVFAALQKPTEARAPTQAPAARGGSGSRKRRKKRPEHAYDWRNDMVYSEAEKEASDSFLRFHVKGSAKEPYVVDFFRRDDNLVATCTCPAGQKFVACKHRINLLQGDFSAVVAGRDALGQIQEILAGTDVEKSLREYEWGGVDRPLAKKALNKTFND